MVVVAPIFLPDTLLVPVMQNLMAAGMTSNIPITTNNLVMINGRRIFPTGTNAGGYLFHLRLSTNAP